MHKALEYREKGKSFSKLCKLKNMQIYYFQQEWQKFKFANICWQNY